MIQKSGAIVLHLLKYSETSIILTLYTSAFGRQSYMVNGIRSTKSKQKMGILQPLFLLEIEADQKHGREVQRLKEFKPAAIYSNLPFDIVKSSMAIFISEVLYKVLRSEEPDPYLFEFLSRSFQYFDTMQQGTANFHLWFLVQLLGYLGFRLDNNYDRFNTWFDMKNGQFVASRPISPNTPSPDDSQLLSEVLSTDVANLANLKLNGQQRAHLLEIVISYYTTHFDSIGTIQSLKVLAEIYH